MKKNIFILLFIVTAINTTEAQEFWVKKFIYTPKDITARVSPQTDDNSQKCAIIKIHTNLRGLKFDCNMGFCGDDIPYDDAGIYKLYVSPGEKRIMIQKEGFIPLEYIIEDYHIKTLEKYKTQKDNINIKANVPQNKNYNLKERKGNIAITTTPSEAEIFINGKYKGTSSIMLYDIMIGDYTIEAKKTNYATTTKK